MQRPSPEPDSSLSTKFLLKRAARRGEEYNIYFDMFVTCSSMLDSFIKLYVAEGHHMPRRHIFPGPGWHFRLVLQLTIAETSCECRMSGFPQLPLSAKPHGAFRFWKFHNVSSRFTPSPSQVPVAAAASEKRWGMCHALSLGIFEHPLRGTGHVNHMWLIDESSSYSYWRSFQFVSACCFGIL